MGRSDRRGAAERPGDRRGVVVTADEPRFPDHFSPVADEYARRRPGYPGAVADLLADLAPSDGLAWDAGCGSGQLSGVLARRFRRVVATDASAEQLARASPHPRVEYRRGPADRSGLSAGSVDLAAAAQAAHWFELDTYYAEVRRVGRPGSIVALLTYGGVTVGPEIDPVIRRFQHEVLAPHWPPERRHVDAAYRTLPFPFEEIPIEELESRPLELRARWTLDELLGYVGTWSAVGALKRAGEVAALDMFRSEMTEAWRAGGAREGAAAPGEPREVRWPLTLRVGSLPSI